MSHFEISVKSYQVRFYGDHPDNYAAVLMLHKEGKRGTIYSLCGNKFYELLPLYYRDLFQACGVDSLDCTMTVAHSKVFIRMTKSIFNVELGERFKEGEREFVWLSIKPIYQWLLE